MTTGNDNWSIEDAAKLYGIHNWGNGNFDLSPQGEVRIKIPFQHGDVAIPLVSIVTAARERGHDFPLLLRVENLLDARIALLNETFRGAIADCHYQGIYQGVFPVKVNQQCQVIEEITHFGARYGHGLEAGSKAELLLALACLPENGLLICNGYKDREFIDLGLWAGKLGYSCFFVIESPTELPLILERSNSIGVRPLIGLRIKVSAKVGGLWTETSGDRSSFGLNTVQLVTVVDELRSAGMLDCLQLLHCHLGSQIPDLNEIRAGVREASRFYAELAGEGVPLNTLDLGGGLAVDYIGNQSNHSHSCNYTLADYCHCLVDTVKQTLDPLGIGHPRLVTESGRATVAPTSMLLFNTLDVLHFEPVDLPQSCPVDAHPLVCRQFELLSTAAELDLSGGYRQAVQTRDQIRDLFRQGEIKLRQRAEAENLFLAIARRFAIRLEQSQEPPEELAGLGQSLADIYYGNFSVFQSLPDTWAIGQTFPVMPIHRLNEKPTREGIISDLTCDCDGKLDRFILANGERRTLPMHLFNKGEDYLLGVFLMGAYQETLGDLHNLFGDTDVISIRINEDGSFDVMKEISGDSVADVLSYVEYNPQTLFEGFRATAEKAVRQGKISVAERQRLLTEFSAQLQGDTYFKGENSTFPGSGGSR